MRMKTGKFCNIAKSAIQMYKIVLANMNYVQWKACICNVSKHASVCVISSVTSPDFYNLGIKIKTCLFLHAHFGSH